MRLGKIRIQIERPLIVRYGFVHLALLSEHVGEVAVRLGRRIQLDHALIGGRSLIEPALILECISKVRVRLGIVLLQRYRTLIVGDRLVQATERAERECYVVVAFRHPFIAGESLADHLDRHGMATGLQGEDAEMMKARNVCRINRNDVSI